MSYDGVLELSAGLAMLTFWFPISTDNFICCCKLLYYPTLDCTRLKLGAYGAIVIKEIFVKEPTNGITPDASCAGVVWGGPADRSFFFSRCTYFLLAIISNTNAGVLFVNRPVF